MHGQDGGHGIDDPLSGVLGGRAADRLEHRHALGIDIGSGGRPHTALDHGAQVGDDISEHVRGHDDVEPLGILDHPHGDRIHVGVVGLDVRILFGHLGEGAHPQIVGVGQNVGLGAEGEFLGLVSFTGVLEGVADAALHTLAGVDHLLDGDLIGGALFQETADAGVQAFGVLPHDHEVDLFGSLVGQRSLHVRIELHRAQIDVLIQSEAEVQEDALLQNTRFHLRMADGAQVDGVEILEDLQRVVGKHLCGFQVVLTPVVEMSELKLDLEDFGDAFENLQAFLNHLRAGPVTGNYCNFVHVWEISAQEGCLSRKEPGVGGVVGAHHPQQKLSRGSQAGVCPSAVVFAELLCRQNHQPIGGEEDPVSGIQHKGPLYDAPREHPLAVAPAPPVEAVFLEEHEADPLQRRLDDQLHVGLSVAAVVPERAGAVTGGLQLANPPDHAAAKQHMRGDGGSVPGSSA